MDHGQDLCLEGHGGAVLRSRQAAGGHVEVGATSIESLAAAAAAGSLRNRGALSHFLEHVQLEKLQLD